MSIREDNEYYTRWVNVSGVNLHITLRMLNIMIDEITFESYIAKGTYMHEGLASKLLDAISISAGHCIDFKTSCERRFMLPIQQVSNKHTYPFYQQQRKRRY